jgi:hypothetical protein
MSPSTISDLFSKEFPMFFKKRSRSMHSSFMTAFLFAGGFAASLQSQESGARHELATSCCSDMGVLVCTTCRASAGLAPILTPGNSEWRIQGELDKPIQPTSLQTCTAEDGDREENVRNHKKKKLPKGKNGSRKPRSSERHQEEHSFSPVHPDALELLRSINKTLKSIEAIAREDAESDRKRPEQPFQPMNKMPRMPMPQMFNPMMPSPQMPSPQMPGPQMHGPQTYGPQTYGPQTYSPQMYGPQIYGPQMYGPQMNGPQMNMPSFDQGPQLQRQDESGPRDDRPQNDRRRS